MYSVRFLLGAAFGLSLGLRNETNGLKGLLYGINVIVFGTSWYDNLHNVQCMSIINSYIWALPYIFPSTDDMAKELPRS